MDKLVFIQDNAPLIVTVVMICMASWVTTTWLKVRHGYPLESSWGKALHPIRANDETVERVKLITGENVQLRAELSAVKERLAVVERIVTDAPVRLDHEIERLRGQPN